MTWQSQLGSLGAGNHFIELTTDADGVVRVMLHSGSRGVGNVMASRFIGIAREKALGGKVRLPDPALAWFDEGTDDFNDYMDAVNWAQAYAKINREIMMEDVMAAVREVMPGAEISSDEPVVDCHHNYVARETHYGRDVWVTRKGSVHAGRGELGIIPGSMGAASYLVEGLGSEESFMSSAHGAGRTMSRTQAKKVFTVADLKRETAGVVCRHDPGVLDEIPSAYKSIDEVMAQQADLVRPVTVFKQFLCVKG
jgi:tRNA-splicing ligase RtcB